MKRLISFILAFAFVTTTVYGATYSDAYVLTDAVQATYNGHKDGRNINVEIGFVDLKGTYGFDIAKLGSLNFLKGYEKNFNPTSNATNLDVLSILLNMEGYEPEAITLAADYQQGYPQFNSLESKNLAYIELATKYGYITEAEAKSALEVFEVTNFEVLVAGQGTKTQVNPNNEGFAIKNPATRVNIAEWINTYLTNTTATLPVTPNIGEYSATDHTSVQAYQIPYVEKVLANGIMSNISGQFKPNDTMNKGELAHTMVALEPYYSRDRGFVTQTGIVGSVKTNQNKTSCATEYQVYVWGTDGKSYVLRTVKYANGKGTSTEIPTYKNGKMINNFSLAVNDSIDYTVATGTDPVFPANTGIFAGVLKSNAGANTVGKLKDVNLTNGTISIAPNENNDSVVTYQMIDGLYNSSGLILGVGTEYERYAPDEIPFGAKYNLTLKGNVVTNIKYIGQDTLIDERRGIIIENQPEFGYMVVLGMDNVKRVYKYYPKQIVVERQPYYDHEDYVGNFDEVFSYDGYDPRDATVYDIEAGDLVFLRPNVKDNAYIDYISVTPNYIQRTGTINKVTVNDGYTTVLVTFDNGQVSSYQVADDVIVKKENKIKDASFLEAGDSAKFLINEAIIDSGYIVESVKEINVEDQGHEIDSVVKGTFVGYNPIQGEIQLSNAQSLETVGWANTDLLDTLALKPNDAVKVYINDVETNITNFNRLLKANTDYQVYLAVEQNYNGPKVKYMTAYDGRDTLLATDLISNVTSNGKLLLQSKAAEYKVKKNAIVVKNDKLVTNSALQPYDLAQVSLNGGDASVVKVVDSIENTGIQVARGRIQSVKDNTEFTVKSLVLLENNKWTYSPIERTYQIDRNTIFLTEDGAVNDISTFIGYTETSVINKVYNIVADGGYAKFIIESPYVNEEVNGTVYKVEDDVVYLKDVNYYDKESKSWRSVGVNNNTATITLAENSITIKDSQVINPNNIQIGDKFFVRTDTLNYETNVPIDVTGYINFIEN